MWFPHPVVKNLGCWLDGQFKKNDFINRVCKASFFHLYNIRRTRKFLSSDCTQILINEFVTNHLDYRNSLLLGLPNNTNYISSNVFRMQLRDSFAMLVGLTTLLLLYLVFIGYLSPIEPSLKSFSLFLKQFTGLLQNIFQNF